ncbi:hypothetical protein TNCT_159462 [Trichonephila clavata]|nr:hypothetical protein TNCT_159462 [Trichonephila clavata]
MILSVFFKNVLKEDFEKHGSWECFEQYLLHQGYADWYDKLRIPGSVVDDVANLPEEFKMKTKQLISRRQRIDSTDIILEEIGNRLRTAYLTREVFKSTDDSLLKGLDLSTPSKKQSSQDEGSISSSCASRIIDFRASRETIKSYQNTNSSGEINSNFVNDFC